MKKLYVIVLEQSFLLAQQIKNNFQSLPLMVSAHSFTLLEFQNNNTPSLMSHLGCPLSLVPGTSVPSAVTHQHCPVEPQHCKRL